MEQGLDDAVKEGVKVEQLHEENLNTFQPKGAKGSSAHKGFFPAGLFPG